MQLSSLSKINEKKESMAKIELTSTTPDHPGKLDSLNRIWIVKDASTTNGSDNDSSFSSLSPYLSVSPMKR